MDALQVPLNSRGGAIFERRDGLAFDEFDYDDPEYRNVRAMLSQRLLKEGHRLLTLGEIESAVGGQARTSP